MVGGAEHVDDGHAEQGWLELTMFSGGPVWFDVGRYGEVLNVVWGEWKDPFAEPLSGENREWVEQAGKWTRFDVTNDLPYRLLIGDVLSVTPEFNRLNDQVAFTLESTSARMYAHTDAADELFIDISPRHA